MSCIPTPSFPPLPDIFPIVLTPPTLPPIDLSANLCCQFHLSIPIPPIPIGAIMLAAPDVSAILLAVNAALDAITSVISQLPTKCPFE